MEWIPVFLVPVIIYWWSDIYRFLFIPHREPDYRQGHFEYWFDEKIAFSSLARKRYKFFEKNSVLYRDYASNQKFIELFDSEGTKFSDDVQQAYKIHIHKKFETIVLGDDDEQA